MKQKIISFIRYALLKAMKKFRQPDDERPIIAATDHLLDKLLPEAFEIFQDSKFREITGFGKMDQVEQDRVFNELEVAVISLGSFCLERRESFIGIKDFHFWKEVHQTLPASFENKLLSFGADLENARLFKELIDVRHEEYSKIADGNLGWMEKEEGYLEIKNERAKEVMASIQAIAVGTADHIRRGKLEVKDELIGFLRRWLFSVNLEIEKFIRQL